MRISYDITPDTHRALSAYARLRGETPGCILDRLAREMLQSTGLLEMVTSTSAAPASGAALAPKKRGPRPTPESILHDDNVAMNPWAATEAPR